MRVILAGGGTAGHINPAIAIANYIKSKEKKAEILFVGTPNGMEMDLVKKAGYNIVPIKVRGFQRKITFKNIIRNVDAIKCLLFSNITAKKIIKNFNPDIVIGTGGYVSGPIVMVASKLNIKTAIHEQNAYPGITNKKIIKNFNPDIVIGTGGYVSGPIVMVASKLNIKTAIHEQNAYPGITNKILSKYVDVVFSAVENSKQYFNKGCNFIVVGNPIRESILYKTKSESRMKLGIDNNFCILSFGGSLGASKINEIAADIIKWHCGVYNINHIHAYGKLGREEFPTYLKERNIDLNAQNRIIVKEYIENMDECLAASDIVICRSGAITISELQATGKASILVPSPYVSENHQFHNAMVMVNNDAAFIIEEKNYNKDNLITLLDNLYKNKDKISKMSKNSLSMSICDTNEKIYIY